MNHPVTSREALLKTAGEIAGKEGLQMLNIRKVASQAGISVGAVYNYFPSKADLIFALMENFWKELAHEELHGEPHEGGFPDYLEGVYRALSLRLSEFRTGYLHQMAMLSDVQKEKGRAVEERYWSHMKKGLMRALERDERIPSALWSEHFTKEATANFLFAQLMGMLRSGEEDFAFLRSLLERLLYQSADFT